jgi:hypothetical protein
LNHEPLQQRAHHGQFERGSLETHVSPRRIAEHETEIDMDEMTIPIDEDISVMSILDLQQKGDDTVSS